MRRPLHIFICLLLVLSLSAAAVAKQDVLAELFYSSAWHDVTSRVYTRDPITISHGAGDEQTGVVPSDAALTFTNRDGEMNPENRKSSLFGMIGFGTPIRITVDSDVRFSGQVASWKPRRAAGALDSTRGDAWVEVQAQGTIRRLSQGTPPIISTLQPVIEADSPYLYLPMEDDRDSTQFASGLQGGSPVVPTGTVAYASIDGAAGMRGPGPSFTNFGTEELRIPVSLSGPFSIEYVVAPATDDDGDVLLGFSYSVAGSSTPFNIGITAPTFVDPTLVGSNGWHHVLITMQQSGADIELRAWFDGEEVTAADHLGATLENLLDIEIGTGSADPPTQPWGVAHLAVHASATAVDAAARYEAMRAYVGETAGDRFERLCGQEGITATIVGSAAETQTMGPQYPDTFLNLLEEIAKTDKGIIHDTRDELGLTLRTGRSLYNQ